MRLVHQCSGKSGFTQIREMAELAFGPGMVAPDEYYSYCLYDDDCFTPEAKRRFIGRRVQIALNHLSNDPAWRAIADDKLIFTDAMRAHGFPTVPTVALRHDFRRPSAGHLLRDTRALQDFLREACYPLFAKPVAGIFSLGTARLEHFLPQSDELVLAGLGPVPLDRFCQEAEFFAGRYEGYLFQPLLHPHPTIEAICGDRIASVRFVVLLDAKGPCILRTAWKIPTGSNIADNFWRAGNLLASLDRETGRVLRVVCGTGPDQAHPECHPDTGYRLAGAAHPRWDEMRELCLAAAATLPGLRLQAWDVALCREGPLLQEVNIGGSYRLQQTADGHGMLTTPFREFLDRRLPRWRSQTTRFILQRFLTNRLHRIAGRGNRIGRASLPL
ncbi:MAG: sugar-transfer associated ATP-grasp domain-containing protein [Hyphomonadaceae bacterium]